MPDLELEKGKRKNNSKKNVVLSIPKVRKIKPKTEDYLIIDFPQEGEVIGPKHYAVRIGSANGESVEISIDNSPWQPCRKGSGYFWYDWTLIPPGQHQCVARKKMANGRYKTSKAVNCSVGEKTSPEPRFL